MPITLADDAADVLFSAGEVMNQVDIKTFVDKVVLASKAAPVPSALTQKAP